MLLSESFAYLRTDAKTDLQSAIPATASQFVNLQVSPGVTRGNAKGYITSVKVQSIQNIDWRVEFHSRRFSQASGPFFTASSPGAAVNNLLDYVSFTTAQATAYATSYLWMRSGLKIPYLDEDGLGEVHMNVVNQSGWGTPSSGTAKLPGDSGALHVAIGFISAA